MTGNPHPDHGPLWVERDANPASDWPHRVRLATYDGATLGVLIVDDTTADAIEAQLTPLPDGVYAKGDELWVAEGFPLDPAAWQHHFPYGGKQPWRTPTDSAPVSVAGPILVRRTPAEPPAPPTEDVPLHELCGRKLPVALWVVQSVRIAGRHIYAFDTLNPFEATISHPVTLNPDGTVTVQAQGVES